MEQNKSYAESLMSIQQQNQPQGSEHGGGPQTQQVELQQLLAQEADLTSRYTDDYPDVVSVRRKIAELRAKIAATPPPPPVAVTSSTTSKATDSVSVQQFRLQMHAMDQEIDQKKRDQAAIQAQLHLYQD